jgi:putative hydrolase of the HAD superfamily
MLKYILFDLDETLYAPTSGLMPAIGNRMRQYLEQEYALPPERAHELQKRYWHEYGTTLRGLMLEREIDPRHYLDFVHDVDVTQYLEPNPQLRAQLAQIPYTKVIVTNADVPHAERVLAQLGIADQFARIFDIVFFEYECKPARGAYERVLNALNARGDECILVEDTARNLSAARELGIQTILLLHPDARAQPTAPLGDPAAQEKPVECPPTANICIEDISQVNAAIETLAARMA